MRQHYIPKFYLAGFASQGSKRSKIWVLDKVERRQWTTIPSKAAHRRNYYRISGQGATDPDAFERAFGVIESRVAPVLREIVLSNDLPASGEEVEILLNFVALMAVRVPGSRDATNRLFDVLSKRFLHGLFSSPETYQAQLQKMKEDGAEIADEVGYEAMREFVSRNEYTTKPPQNLELRTMLGSFRIVLELLAKRTWFLLIARECASDFVTSDRPVTLDWTREPPGFPWVQPGFGMPDSIVRFPLSPRVVLAGLFTCAEPRCAASQELVARTNACTCRSAERFIYASSEDFVWMHRDGAIRDAADLLEELEAAEPKRRT